MDLDVLCEMVAESPLDDVLHYIGKENLEGEVFDVAVSTAAGNGRLDIIKFLYLSYPKEFDSCSFVVAEWAASAGCVEILEFMDEKGKAFRKENVAIRAASAGRLNVIEWLHEKGAKIDARVFSTARKYSHSNVMKWCVERGYY